MKKESVVDTINTKIGIKKEDNILQFNKCLGGGMVDTLDSKSGIRKGVGVQVPPEAPLVKVLEPPLPKKVGFGQLGPLPTCLLPA